MSKKIYKLVLYFIKKWDGTKFTVFQDLDDNFLKYRTNNHVERFNHLLNKNIKHTQPKLSYFLEKYKIIIKTSSYDNYNSLLRNVNEFKEDESYNFITKNIYNFSLNLIFKYKSELG